VARDHHSPTPALGTSILPGVPQRPIRILILDDDASVRQLLARMIDESGYTPVVASNWTEALKLYREGNPDLILLDVMMPGMDGYKVASLFRREGGKFVPIILLTALEDLESKRRGMAAGADDFLTKPVGSLELQIRVNSMLRIKVLTDELAQANARLAQLAVTDALTGLHNRRFLYQQLEREFARAQRYCHPLSCLLLDIDHFKLVNDGFGHQTGDRVLVLVGQVLLGAIRNTDLAGRCGGEEFMILAPETTHEQAVIVAERVRTRLAEQGVAGGEVPPVTISIGVASTDHPQASSPEELVRLADQALYRAKSEGRNRVAVSR
jgi:two-component system cell cycle response regulator